MRSTWLMCTAFTQRSTWCSTCGTVTDIFKRTNLPFKIEITWQTRPRDAKGTIDIFNCHLKGTYRRLAFTRRQETSKVRRNKWSRVRRRRASPVWFKWKSWKELSPTDLTRSLSSNLQCRAIIANTAVFNRSLLKGGIKTITSRWQRRGKWIEFPQKSQWVRSRTQQFRTQKWFPRRTSFLRRIMTTSKEVRARPINFCIRSQSLTRRIWAHTLRTKISRGLRI